MDETTRDPRLGRRLLVVRLAAGLGAAAAAGEAGAAGRAPVTPAGQGATTPVRTDNDPSDAAGYGRGGYSGGGRTDNDPRDSAGYGRGGYAPPRRSVTDNDPSDGAGRGRGWR